MICGMFYLAPQGSKPRFLAVMQLREAQFDPGVLKHILLLAVSEILLASFIVLRLRRFTVGASNTTEKWSHKSNRSMQHAR